MTAKSTSTSSLSSSLKQALPSWSQQKDHVIDWDDGFSPSGCNKAPGKMVATQTRSHKKIVRVFDDAISPELAQDIYRATLECPVWGVYVNKNEVLHPRRSNPISASSEDIQQHLATEAVRQLFQEKCRELLEEDWDNVHGVAVWAIASDVGKEVQYHIDYAEMFRFQTNITYPPMYGATLHVTDITGNECGMEGGDFYVNVDGLDHYKRWGYKMQCTSPEVVAEELLELDASNWERVKYKYNRAIFCDGDLPHFSSRIKSLPREKKRVVVGFNLFNYEIGPYAEEYPEHSAKFNKYVKLSQAIKTEKGLSLEDVKKNPKLAAFLKLLLQRSKQQEVMTSNQQHSCKKTHNLPENSSASHPAQVGPSRLSEKNHLGV